MKFSDEINQYIKGVKFSEGLDISFADEKYPDQRRIDKIIELTRSKRVVHIGCADHLPLINDKIKNNNWLHGLLNENSAACIGIDINEKAISYINQELKIQNVYLADKHAEQMILEKEWDYLVLGEIIEHIDNPVAFLFELREKYKNNINSIIITAPNVYNLLTVKDIKNNIENINTDHRYWFSPYTLTKIVSNSGYQNPEIFFTERVKLPVEKAIVKRIKQLFNIPLYFKANCFSNLIISATLK